MADRLFASNDTKGYTKSETHLFFAPASGNFTADATPSVVVAPFACTVVDVIGSVGQNGVDVSNPLDLKFTASKNGTALCTTDPDIAKAAGTGVKTTAVAGTGITQAVVKSDGTQTVAKGDLIKVLFDITRTASPGTEIADAAAIVVVRPLSV
jgi:hypothetical protein